MARKRKLANVVGPQVQKARYALGLTQEEFAGRCQLAGLDISRGTLSQIEARLRCVVDSELFLLAKVLGLATDALFPEQLRRTRGVRTKRQAKT
jgi:transcriptional regulator with XRE-family HTH domain